ncbi:hypothetical protein [Fibrisoma montanum]|uniref:hypothetical protein n=1 Tax=Fibrisoma montanum TaxID=2305895 RepID=UPI001314EEEA|nr:hypothetical protein [Fibrisoma montanum]
MYDLEANPQETNNLANPSHPKYNDPVIAAERDRLHQKLLRLEQEKLGAAALAVEA